MCRHTVLFSFFYCSLDQHCETLQTVQDNDRAKLYFQVTFSSTVAVVDLKVPILGSLSKYEGYDSATKQEYDWLTK